MVPATSLCSSPDEHVQASSCLMNRYTYASISKNDAAVVGSGLSTSSSFIGKFRAMIKIDRSVSSDGTLSMAAVCSPGCTDRYIVHRMLRRQVYYTQIVRVVSPPL